MKTGDATSIKVTIHGWKGVRDMIPIYSFLEGDSLGLLIFAYEDETIQEIINKVQISANLRVKPRTDLNLYRNEKKFDPKMTVKEAGLLPLEIIHIHSEVQNAVSSRVSH